MSILIGKNSRVMTQGITGKTGQFHTQTSRAYANGRSCFVAGVNPKKAGEDFEGIPIYGTVKDAKARTGANVSVIYVPPPFAAAAIDAMVDRPLTEFAGLRLRQARRAKYGDQDLADLVNQLHEEERLVIGSTDKDEIKIVCSIGVRDQ